jgi:hypothetical protein
MNAHPDLSGYDADIEYGCYCVERDLGALENGILYGPASDYGAVGSGWLNVYSLGYAANVKNIARLKARIKRLKATRDARLAGVKWAGRKRRIKRRYDRRIRRAQKRLDRIERVMRRRIAKRLEAGKELTRRQRRIQAALRSGRMSPAVGRRLKALALRSTAAPTPGGLISAPTGTYATDALPDGDTDLLPGAGDLPESSMDAGLDLLPEEQPIYKQPWFVGMVGIAVLGGILYTTRKDKAA